MSAPCLVWFRHDLRLADHPALRAAMDRGGPVIPIFIWSPEVESPWHPGAATKVWLHRSLDALLESFAEIESRLVIRQGDTLEELQSLLQETGADAVFWNRRYEPAVIERDREIKSELKAADVEVRSFNGSLLNEPWEIANQQGKPYQVFTQYWKTCRQQGAPREPLPKPRKIETPKKWPGSLTIDDLELLPTLDWDTGFWERWTPGETAAMTRLREFLNDGVNEYDELRNRPDKPGSSRLSPHLHFGEITPHQVFYEIQKRELSSKAVTVFENEIGWREFAHHLLFHFPETPTEPLREKYADFPWEPDAKQLRAWQRGQTGFPIVDAGMRELWTTGWMHNRVRMIVASFLTKDLLIPWQQGAEWFWDTLVDADLANNTLGWQWTAGCGADASPYFRVFNPTTQSQKFDPDGDYIRRWVPELVNLDAKHIHEPSAVPKDVLQQAGITIGKDYPKPMVDHAEARKQALKLYESLK